MRGDQPNYYRRKADSTNLDSIPGARKKSDARRRADVLWSESYPRVGDGYRNSIDYYIEKTREAKLRFLEDINSGQFAIPRYYQTYDNYPVSHRSFICPICGQDIREVMFCRPENKGRLVFDPETVVDANPNRPELE